jgi:membrane protein DedA with SNARE-associated domain
MTLLDYLETLRSLHPGLVLPGLFLASLVEYLIPPFPGDTVTLAAAVIYAQAPFLLLLAFLVCTVGSVLGAMLVLLAGIGMGRHVHPKHAGALETLLAGFKRFGAPLLLANRFFPGIRPVFFLAAGLAGISKGRTLLFAALGATAWNALLFFIGVKLGGNLPELAAATAQLSAWGRLLLVCLAAALLTALLVWTIRRRR